MLFLRNGLQFGGAHPRPDGFRYRRRSCLDFRSYTTIAAFSAHFAKSNPVNGYLRWCAERNVSAAERFDVEFDRTLQTIAYNPARSPKCDELHQYCLMHYCLYQIIYRQYHDH